MTTLHLFDCGKNFLEKLSQNRKDLIKNFLMVFALRGVQKIAAIIMIYFLVRGLSQEQFAFYSLVLTAMGLLSVFTLPELTTTITQSVARGFNGTYRKVMPLSFLTSWLGSFCLIGGSLWYYLNEANNNASALLIAAICFPFSMGLEQWKGLKKGLEDFKAIAWFSGQIYAIQSALITGSILLFPGNYVLPILFFCSTGMVRNIIQTIRALHFVKPDDKSEEGSMKYGIKATIYSFANTLANQLDKLLLYFFISPIDMALLVVAEKIPELIKNLIQDVANVMMPRFAKHKEYTKKTDKQLKILSGFFAIGIVVFAFLFLPLFFESLFSSSYTDALPYAIALLCTIALGNFATLRSRFIMSKLDISSYRDITLGMSFTRIIASLILVPTMGLAGAVISTILYRLVMIGIVEYIFRTRYKFILQVSQQ
ncbi:MAG TPA: oligosaccharide flippase family protein [Alphaproteobacteria bacterium]|nr:oligosaccharide flippase family protein [Alphaproteobacteria bacterium]